MKILKLFLGVFSGVVLGSLICWGSLYLYGKIILKGNGSLFDTNPDIANMYFILWGVISFIFALTGAVFFSRPKK